MLDEFKCKYILQDHMAKLTFLAWIIQKGVIERLSECRVQRCHEEGESNMSEVIS